MLEDIRLQENDGYDLESASELVNEVYESHYVYTSASPIIHYQRNLPSSAVTETAPLLVIALRDLFWLDVQSTALLFDDFWLGDSEGTEFMERLVCPSSFFPQVYGGYGLWPDCTYETGGWAKGAVFYDCEHTYMEADSYGPLIGDFSLLRTDRGLPPYTEEWYQTSDCFMQWLNWQILFTRISERDSWVNGGPEDVIFEVSRCVAVLVVTP